MLLNKWLTQPIAHISTGAKRRALWPPERGVGIGARESLLAEDVAIRREFLTLPGGEKMFYQVVEPVGRVASHIVVWLHGYMSNSDMHLENMLKVARRGAIVVMPDLPGHGRSDGLLCYTPDWWAFVGSVWEFLDAVVEPLRGKLSNPRKVFAMGASLGGGLATCLALQRPVYFEGLILIAPMLFVSDEIKPPKIVQQLFKLVIKPLLPTWPLTPTKPMEDADFEVPGQGKAWERANPFGMAGLQPRLATAFELAFTFPDWLQDRMTQLRTPFIVLHSRKDTTTDPHMSERLHKEAAATDKTLRLYDEGLHCELFCCTPGNSKFIGMKWNPAQVERTDQCFKDIFEWLAPRV